jgi:hypothetical protein
MKLKISLAGESIFLKGYSKVPSSSADEELGSM